MRIHDITIGNMDLIVPLLGSNNLPTKITRILDRVTVRILFDASLPELDTIKKTASSFFMVNCPTTYELLKEDLKNIIIKPMEEDLEAIEKLDINEVSEKSFYNMMMNFPIGAVNNTAVAIFSGYSLLELSGGDLMSFFKGDISLDPFVLNKETSEQIKSNIAQLFVDSTMKRWLENVTEQAVVTDRWLLDHPYKVETSPYFALNRVYLEGGSSSVSFVDVNDDLERVLTKLGKEYANFIHERIFAEITCRTPLYHYYLYYLNMEKGFIMDTLSPINYMVGDHDFYGGEDQEHSWIPHYERVKELNSGEVNVLQQYATIPGTMLVDYTVKLELGKTADYQKRAQKLVQIAGQDPIDVNDSLIALITNIQEIVRAYCENQIE